MSIMAKTPSGYKKIGFVYLGERPVDKVFNANGDVVYALQRELTGVPPLLFKGKEQSELLNYRIYGDTVGGNSVGELVESGEHAGEYKVTVTVEGKNLCNNVWEQKSINANTGIAADSDNIVCCDFIPVKSNVTYSLSRTVGNGYANLRCYDVNKNYLGTGTDNANKGNPITGHDLFGRFVITNTNVAFIRFNDASNSLNTKYMLVEGEYAAQTMPSYEPYHAPVTTPIYIPEPIKMVGDEAEYIDYAEQKLHRVRKNLLPMEATSTTIKGVTFTVNADKSVTCNGTNNETSDAIFEFYQSGISLEVDESYIVSGCPEGGKMSGGYTIQYYNGSGWSYETGHGATFTVSGSGLVRSRIIISRGVTVDNLTFYPMVRKATITNDTYEPYIENTEVDVTLPTLPVMPGTNQMSIDTEVQPSRMDIKGRIKTLT